VVFNAIEPNYPLADLPLPDVADFDPDRYRLGKKPLATVITSRGCPHRCEFCSVQATFGSHYRWREARDVVAEIRTRWDQGYRAFDFEDDNLNADPIAAKELFRALLTEFGERALALHAMNGLSYRGLDADLLDLLRRAGFTHLNLSLVSCHADVCRRSGRPHSLAAFEQAVGGAVSRGLRVVAYHILGLPGESLDRAAETLAYLARLPVLVGTSPFYLPPGSPMTAGLPEPGEEELVRVRLTALGTGPDVEQRDRLYTLFIAARVVNFLKGMSTEGEDVPLSTVLARAQRDGGRAAPGAEILGRLLADGILFGATREGLRKLPRFHAPLFQEFWAQLGFVGTLDRGRVRTAA